MGSSLLKDQLEEVFVLADDLIELVVLHVSPDLIYQVFRALNDRPPCHKRNKLETLVELIPECIVIGLLDKQAVEFEH